LPVVDLFDGERVINISAGQHAAQNSNPIPKTAFQEQATFYVLDGPA
jgi:hypothetical protein